MPRNKKPGEDLCVDEPVDEPLLTLPYSIGILGQVRSLGNRSLSPLKARMNGASELTHLSLRASFLGGGRVEEGGADVDR